jgi:UDP-N-acetylglucosamine/UDP-N-acetylgalactosamine diphosphorylase
MCDEKGTQLAQTCDSFPPILRTTPLGGRGVVGGTRAAARTGRRGHVPFAAGTIPRIERTVEHPAVPERQEHLLAGLEALDEPARRAFLDHLAQVDWAELERPEPPPEHGDVEQAHVVTLDELERRRDELTAAGEEVYAAGAAAVLMVAGGQGTRLGFPGPKGCFPLAPHSGKTVYQLQAEKVVSLSRRTGRDVPFLVMTSPATDDETRTFFAEHGNFGLAPGQLTFFCQGTVPSLDRDGRALLREPGQLLENPDGHGGAFSALVAGGELDRLVERGVTALVYIQVDNVLAPVDDPLLVGLAAVERADVVTKVLEKAHAEEKVGALVRVGGRDRIVEYTELTPADMRQTGADGMPLYRWGSPALHCWSVDFLAGLARSGYHLPLHRSAKPLEAWADGKVRRVDGWKYERFIFDLLPLAGRSVGMEIDRAAEFAPVKNADGADSPATAVELASRQYASWLEAAGVRVELPDDARVEISPLLAATRDQFVATWDDRLDEVTGDLYIE